MSSPPSDPYADEEHGYIIATYILAPTLFLVGLMVAMYVCCNKKYRLNWFERTLLEQEGRLEDGAAVNEGSALTGGEKDSGGGASSRVGGLGCVEGEEEGEEEGRYLLGQSYQQAGQLGNNNQFNNQVNQFNNNQYQNQSLNQFNDQSQYQDQGRYQGRYQGGQGGGPPPPQKYKSGVVSARVTPISPPEVALNYSSSQHASRHHWYPLDLQQGAPPPPGSRDQPPQPRCEQQSVRAQPWETYGERRKSGGDTGGKGARGAHSLRHGTPNRVPGCEDALTGSGGRVATSGGAQGNALIGETLGRRPQTQQLEEKAQQRWSQSLGQQERSEAGRGGGGRIATTTTTASTTSSTAASSFFSFFSALSPRPQQAPDNTTTTTTTPPSGQDGNYTTATTTTTTSPWHHSNTTHHSNTQPPHQQQGKYALLVAAPETSPSSSVSSASGAYTCSSMGSLSSTPGGGGADPGGGGGTSASAPASRLSPRNSLTPSVGGGSGEGFWVPPAVLQKKRAQSLIPSLLHHPDSDDSSSPSRTPTTSTSLQEMAFSFPPERLTETVSMVQAPAAVGPGAGHRTRRRASMQDALDATMINTSLYDSIQVPPPPQEFGSIQEEQLGSIHFSLDYNPEQGLLTVRLIQARDLVPRDFSGTADPYCRLCLLPQRRPQLQSKLQKKTTSPEFGEDFIFEVMPDDIDQRTLEILVYDYDQYSRDEPIGEVCLPLEEVDLTETVALWKGISQPTKQAVVDESLGDLMVSMSYLASAERLTISVLKARYLQPPEDGKNTSNPFVKVQVILGTKRLKKKKTSTKKNTLNPTWNEALVFNLSKELLPRVTLEFFVCSDNLLGSNETLGKMSLGPDSTGEELAHWKDMIAVRSSNAMYHKLLPPPQESPVYQNLGRRCSDFS